MIIVSCLTYFIERKEVTSKNQSVDFNQNGKALQTKYIYLQSTCLSAVLFRSKADQIKCMNENRLTFSLLIEAAIFRRYRWR